MNTKITGQEAYDMMIAIMENGPKVREHFHWNSELWRAIEKHIESNERTLITLKYPIVSHRGTGAAISFIKAYTHHPTYETREGTFGSIKIIPKFFTIELEIELYDEDEDKTFNMDFKLNVPIDLLINFTQKKFQKWVRSESVSNLDKIINQTTNRIKEIVDGLPNDVIIKVLDQLHETIS